MILFKNFLYGGSIIQNKSDMHIGFLQANTAVVPCRNVVAFYFILVVFYLNFIYILYRLYLYILLQKYSITANFTNGHVEQLELDSAVVRSKS